MKKTKTKFFYYSIAILSVFIFLFIFLSYITSSAVSSTVYKVLIWISFSFVMSTLITYGYTLTSSTIADAMFTLRRMIRAENLSNPLLLKLSSEAPGTYHHSLNVSNIAQKVAKAIGCNSLLVRVASYYHDIGKLNDPTLYIENQKPSDFLAEENSALWIKSNAKKIISHVENGVKIAKEAKLPEDIIEIILEHHGDSKAWYFYQKAQDKNLKIKLSDFSYMGPRPTSKESAIVMLSDCVEAHARAIQPSNIDAIKEIVESTIADKLKEKQLESSGLSSREIITISNVLKESLASIYHQRINYLPKNDD